jgi:hypothetical protein
MDGMNKLYPTGRTEIRVLFDLRIPGVAERLRREQSGWCGLADIEELEVEHAVLVIRPGGALGVRR